MNKNSNADEFSCKITSSDLKIGCNQIPTSGHVELAFTCRPGSYKWT